MFYKPKHTVIGEQGNCKVWISKVPCKLIGCEDNKITLKAYDLESNVVVSKEVFDKEFEAISLEQNISIDFEEKRFKKGRVVSLVKNDSSFQKLNKELQTSLLKMIDKTYTDAYTAAGSTKTMTVSEYIDNCDKNSNSKKRSTIRYSPLFNRRSRNCCVVESEESQSTSGGCQKPIGIRPIDFATKSEQNEIFKTLLLQLFQFKNCCPMPQALLSYLNFTIVDAYMTHKCKYCNEPMNLAEVCQTYSMKMHYLNLCHEDPNFGTKASNLYWGHTKCNRLQGGFSVFERCHQGLAHLEDLMVRSENIPDELQQHLNRIIIMYNKKYDSNSMLTTVQPQAS